MKLSYPIKDFKWTQSISQLFGVNRKLYKANFNIPGHQGLDIVIRNKNNGYGTKIKASHNGIVEKLVQDVPLRTKGNGIYLLDESGKFSTIYWHLSQINCYLGQKIKTGETIGLLGNSGFVRPVHSTNKPFAGAHLHWGVKSHNLPYRNAYKQFVDPTPWLFKKGDKLPIYWPVNLYIGLQNDYVSWLQTVLKIEGFAKDYDATGFFGYKTLRDVIGLQKKYNINPPLGFVGRLTREFLSKKYSSYYE